MERYSHPEEIAKMYFQNFSWIISTERAFRRVYPNRRASHGEIIYKMAQ